MCQSTVWFLVCNRIIDELAQKCFRFDRNCGLKLRVSDDAHETSQIVVAICVAGDTLEVILVSSSFTYELASRSESFYSRRRTMDQFWFKIDRNLIRWCFRSQLISFPCCIMRCISEKISNFTWRWWWCTNCGCVLSHWCMIYVRLSSIVFFASWEDPTWCNFISCNIEVFSANLRFRSPTKHSKSV